MPYMLASRSVLPHFSISNKFFFLYLSHQTTYGFKILQLTEASTKESGIDFLGFSNIIYIIILKIFLDFTYLEKLKEKNRILVVVCELRAKFQIHMLHCLRNVQKDKLKRCWV
jgi:hypothetical protein